jgi:hypothetical protein
MIGIFRLFFSIHITPRKISPIFKDFFQKVFSVRTIRMCGCECNASKANTVINIHCTASSSLWRWCSFLGNACFRKKERTNCKCFCFTSTLSFWIIRRTRTREICSQTTYIERYSSFPFWSFSLFWLEEEGVDQMSIRFLISLLVCIALTISYCFEIDQRSRHFRQCRIPTAPFHFFFAHLKTLWTDQDTVPTFVVSDLDFLQEAFVKQFVVFQGRKKDDFKNSTLPNVFSWWGTRWCRHRHVIRPTFSEGELKLLSLLINGCLDHWMEKWPDHVNSEDDFNIYLYYKRMTRDVIWKDSVLNLFSLRMTICQSVEEQDFFT